MRKYRICIIYSLKFIEFSHKEIIENLKGKIKWREQVKIHRYKYRKIRINEFNKLNWLFRIFLNPLWSEFKINKKNITRDFDIQ